MNWSYFALGVFIWPFLVLLAKGFNRLVVEHRKRRFLKLVSVRFIDRKSVTFIAVDTTDRRAIKRLEQDLRRQYDVREESA